MWTSILCEWPVSPHCGLGGAISGEGLGGHVPSQYSRVGGLLRCVGRHPPAERGTKTAQE